MIRQYLLDVENPPNEAILRVLTREGIPIVRITAQPEQIEGKVIVEREPVMIGGVLWQAWAYEDAPPPEEPEAEPVPDLTKPQFEYLLALTGLGDIWEALEVAVKKASLEMYAELRGSRARDVFRYEVTLEMVDKFRPFAPPGFDLTPEALLEHWNKALTF